MKHSLLGLLLLASVALSAQTLDQQQTTINNARFYDPNNNQFLGQTFTAGLTGSLNKITLRLEDANANIPGSPSFETTVRVYPTDNSGLPLLNQVLATTTAMVSGLAAGYDFTFSSPAFVAAGTKYAFAISTTATSGGQGVLPDAGVATSNAYVSGDFFSQPAGSSVITLDSNQDLYFKTYVTAALPVRLISFTAQPLNQQALLQWQTSLESNTDQFVISRSTNALSFEAIGRVKAVGNSTGQQNYRFVDEAWSQTAPTVYYRLRAVDFDGSYSDSPIIALSQQEALASFRAYPNPIGSGGVVQLEGVSETQQVQLLDAWGRSVDLELSHPSASQTELRTGPLTPGVYVLGVQSERGRQTQKLVVN